MSIEQLLNAGRRFHRQGRMADAERCYRQALSVQENCVDAMYLLGMIRYRTGQVRDAMALLQQALEIAPEHALALGTLGQILLDRREVAEAGERFQRALAVDPDNADLLYGLSLAHAWSGRLAEARETLERLVRRRPDDARAWLNLGNLLRRTGRMDNARAAYEQCLQLSPDFAEAHNNLGALAQQQQHRDEALACFESALRTRPTYAEALSNLGALLDEMGRTDEALAAYQSAMDVMPSFVEAYINSGLLLSKRGDAATARQTLELARRVDPDHLPARWANCIGSLSLVYHSAPAMQKARDEYRAELQAFVSKTDLSDARTLDTVSTMVGSMQPFQLAYQGQNDLALQRQYGGLICEAMEPLNQPLAELSDTQPLRVGIVSAFFRDHSNWKCPLQGWSRYLGQHVELHGFHVGHRQDAVTDSAGELFHRFHRLPDEDSLLRAIRRSRLHCLIYPELGMDNVTLRLAARRLAPLQCTAWGHPETSGMPTMDWYLSSDLMEPDNGAEHYSERLVRLPGLSFSFRFEQQVQGPLPDRSSFGLDEDDVVYLCVQNLSKYLPQHDGLLTAIAAAVPGARLVFIEGPAGATRALRLRLQAALAREGIDPDRALLFLPRLDKRRYLALNQVADVFLDTPGWSGCNSTLEALQQGLPVITLTGELMRGRHSTAIYRIMEWTALVAADERDYVDLAVTLGTDPVRRRECRQRIRDSIPKLEGQGQAEAALAGLLAAHFAEVGGQDGQGRDRSGGA